PPTLTNITLIYLPPCKTAYLQPLDMGIIKSFKAAYHRLYAEYMVERFNEFGATLEKIDILKAIYLSSTAWDSLTPSTIQNCWTKANITTTSIPSDISSPVDI
ncbi:DDE-domain-containing protein, partial [Tuber magnatum]